MSDDCYVHPIHRQIADEEYQKIRTAVLTVNGMNCPHCATRVRNSLVSLPGVTAAHVDHLSDSAQVTFNPDLTSLPALLDAVTQAGGDGHHEYAAIVTGR
jgi:copper chaperone CopZ